MNLELNSNQEKYWDFVSGFKEFPTPFQMAEFEKRVSKDMAILDVGCGYGRTLNELYQNGFVNLFGVDFSQGMIDRGLKLFPYLNLRKNEGGKLPFPDNSFEAVILIAVLTCIYDDESQYKLISEIERVLKPGGILYINDYLLNSDLRNIERYEKYQNKYKRYGVFELPEGAIVRHHTEEYFWSLMNDFDKIVFQQLIYTTMNGNKSNGFYYIGKKKNGTTI